MALQVWLPLTGNLKNKGLSDYSLSMFRGTETYNNAGKIGKCFYSNGVNTIKILNIIPDFYNYKSYSLCAWFYIESNNTSHSASAIISAGDWNHDVLNLAVANWHTDHYTQLRITGSNWDKYYSYDFVKNVWYHVVVCSDGIKTYAYVNGTMIGDTISGYIPSSIDGNDICIGGATYYSGMQFFGKINDIRIYDHCLSPKEVKELSKGLVAHYPLNDQEFAFNDSVIHDCSGYGHDGTVTGKLIADNDTPRYSISTYFDGSSYAKTLSGELSWTNFETMTISAWIKPVRTPSNWVGGIGIAHDAGANYKSFSISNYGGKFTVNVADGNWVNIQSSYTTPLNEWHYYVATLDNTTIKMYVDGELVHTATIDWKTAALHANPQIQIGVDLPGSDEIYAGYYSDVRIYATALSAEDIKSLYETRASIDNYNNIYAYELMEV